MKEDTGDETDYNDPGERQDSKLSSRYGAGGGGGGEKGKKCKPICVG